MLFTYLAPGEKKTSFGNKPSLMLAYFVLRPNRALSRGEIIDNVWGRSHLRDTPTFCAFTPHRLFLPSAKKSKPWRSAVSDQLDIAKRIPPRRTPLAQSAAAPVANCWLPPEIPQNESPRPCATALSQCISKPPPRLTATKRHRKMPWPDPQNADDHSPGAGPVAAQALTRKLET